MPARARVLRARDFGGVECVLRPRAAHAIMGDVSLAVPPHTCVRHLMLDAHGKLHDRGLSALRALVVASYAPVRG